MKVSRLHFNDTNLLRPLMADYINENAKTKLLYNFAPNPLGILKAIEERKKFQPNRQILVDALKLQYSSTGIYNDLVEKNIELLKNDNCFTITTGHQLNLFGSTQYFIYKIVEVIKYTRLLKEKYSAYNFVPVFWLASDDHDFDEISFAHINGKKYQWQSNEKGSVGRFNPHSVLQIINELNDFWHSEPSTGVFLKNLFTEAYSKPTLSQATRFWTHELFKQYGLVVIDGDDIALKKQFSSIIKQEIFEETTFKNVEKTNAYLLKNNYHIQVHARPINLFMMTEFGRERIVKLDNCLATVESAQRFTYYEIEKMIDEKPNAFSPNALMRPMYQEVILPNLAYIGGAGEIAYWLQIKDAFKAVNIFYPQVISRNSAIWLSRRLGKKLEKTGLSYSDLFVRKEDLIAQYAESHRSGNLFFQLSDGIEILWQEFELASEKAFHDLKIKTGTTAAKNIKELKKLRHDMRKIVKAKNDAEILILNAIYDTIFPNGGFQERVDTFLPSYMNLGQSYFDSLFEHIKPAEHQVIIFEY